MWYGLNVPAVSLQRIESQPRRQLFKITVMFRSPPLGNRQYFLIFFLKKGMNHTRKNLVSLI